MSAMINRRDVLTSTLAFSIAAAFQLREAVAQGWPSRYLKLLVGAGPGSVPDSLARLAADALSKKTGSDHHVENRAVRRHRCDAGRGGEPARRLHHRVRDDVAVVFNSYLFTKLPYDPVRDLKPISTLAWSASVLTASPSLSASTLPEVVALSRKEPGKLLLGIGQSGSPPHIAALLLMRRPVSTQQSFPSRRDPTP